MKRLLILLGFLACLGSLHSQEDKTLPPDWDSIKTQTADSASQFFYPGLLRRFIARDTTLSFNDFRYLYFGYTFQPGYKPYWISPYEEKLVKYYRQSEIRQKDYAEIIRLIELSLAEYPFDLRQMNFLAYVYQMKGDMATANRLRFAFSGIITAILSSGDGTTCLTGFHVISTSHEYVLLNMFEFQFTSQALTPDRCDYMEVKKDHRGIEGIFFNINRLWDVANGKLSK